jgi:hypothetical protein
MKIVAKEGMVLTNGQAYGIEVFLGKNSKPEDWWEITREQYDEIINAPSEEATEEDYQNSLREMGV